MKVIAEVFMCASIVGSILLSPAVSVAGPLGSMRVKLIEGDVQVKIAETGEWAPASINMPLVEGDELWVPEGGRSAIQTSKGAYIRLDRNTALQVIRASRNSLQFHITQGRVYVLNVAPGRSVLQFDTPDASIRTFGESTFRIDVPGDETDVLALRGSVTAENPGGMTKVEAGNMLALGDDGYAELAPLPRPDEWQAWNENRDRVVLARGKGNEYLPDTLRVYSSDFDENGRWVNVPEYGPVWTPTVVVTSNWAPYRNGRWVWRGGEYVWIGYEPWGWAPYHYGRWSFFVGIGWGWIPPARGDVFWAPGYVGWVRTGDYVAWVPLAPREVYYGRGNYGRHSVNITNVNITQVNVTNVYRNANTANGVTVVHQTTFLTGRTANVQQNVISQVREDFSRRRNIVVGRPPIQPVRASYIPVERHIQETNRPPEAVRKIDMKELKRTRPLVNKPDQSTIQPKQNPRPLEVRRVEKQTPRNEMVKERKQVKPAERGLKMQTSTPPANVGKPSPPPRTDRQKALPPVKEKPQAATPVKERQQAAPPVRDGKQATPKAVDRQKAAPPVRERKQPTPPEKDKKQAPPPKVDRPKATPHDNVSHENPKGGGERGGERGNR
jgi:hypothetical protein